MIRILLVLLFAVLAPTSASAHLLPKQSATVRIVDNSAYLVVSVPASALSGIDDDANGTLSLEEIGRHNQDIARQFEARFSVRDKTANGSRALTMVMSPLTDGETDETDYVVVLHTVSFDTAPTQPSIETDLFGTGAGEDQFRVRATLGETVENTILAAGNPGHTFFRGSLAVLTDFIRIGFEHIWAGADHLVFLLTVVVIGASWRHWLAVITSFTIAHSITLALSALNILRIPAAVVEPGIALSIVIMAGLNLLAYARGSAASHTSGWPRVAIVFACGLLHGFGFASAIGAMSMDAGNRVATLAGFNIGIEAGQLLFVGLVLALIALIRKLALTRMADRLPVAASVVALGIGSFWLVERAGIV